LSSRDLHRENKITMSILELYNSTLAQIGEPLAAAAITLAQVIENEREQTAEPTPDFLTVKQAAKKFNLGQRTIYRMIENGLPVIRAGRAVRLKPRDLTKWMADSGIQLR
jgi:excisionase family DNA binding protein